MLGGIDGVISRDLAKKTKVGHFAGLVGSYKDIPSGKILWEKDGREGEREKGGGKKGGTEGGREEGGREGGREGEGEQETKKRKEGESMPLHVPVPVLLTLCTKPLSEM